MSDMFKEFEITTLEGVFDDKLYVNSFPNSDKSMQTTARVLLYPRLDNIGNRFRIDYVGDWFANDYRQCRGLDMVNRVMNCVTLVNNIVIFDCGDCDEFFESVRDGFKVYKEKRKQNDEIELTGIEKLFASKKIKSAVYHIPNKRQSLVFIYGRCFTSARNHLIQSVLPALMPQFFENAPLTDTERELMTALMEDDAVKYEKIVGEFCRHSNLRLNIIRKKLSGFTKAADQNLIDNLRQEINYRTDQINRLDRQITDMFREIEDSQVRIAAIESKIAGVDDTDNEVVELFASSKTLNLIQVNKSQLVFEIKSTLDNYDADLYETIMKNARSILYTADYCGIGKEDGVLLMNSIFHDQKLRVQMKAKFYLDFGSGYWDISREYSNWASDAVRNPHLTYYKCLGNNERVLSKALRERDYIGSIMTCVAICSNLNLSESQNVQNFIRDFIKSHGKVIVLPDGTQCTVDEAIKYLHQESNQE